MASFNDYEYEELFNEIDYFLQSHTISDLFIILQEAIRRYEEKQTS